MKRFVGRMVFSGVAAAAMLGCGSADTEWQGTVRDSAGVAIVSNAAGGSWGRGDAWTVTEELRIGTAEGEPQYQFGQIVGLDVDRDGRIYVMDQQAHEVRVFGPEGDFLLAMGKAGSGPGELSQQAGPVFVGPDGTVAVPDMMNQRINRYSPDGEPAGSEPLPMTDGIPARWLKAENQDLVQQAMVMAFPGMTDVEPRNLILRRTPEGAVKDTLLVLPAGETVDFAGGQPRMRIFSPEPMWAIGPQDRVIHGNNAEYRIHVKAADGTLERIIEKQGQRRPVTTGDQDAFRRLIRQAWERAGMPPQAMEMMSQAISFADHYPAYANILGGPYGTIWVQRVQTPEMVEASGGSFDMQDIGGPDWDVFDEEGRFLGVVPMPPRFTPAFFHNEVYGYSVYGVQRDEMDVQYVARLRVEAPAPADGRP